MKPNTAKDYVNRIKKIIKDENITIQTLSVGINEWIVEYKTGKYANINKQRHYAPSSALVKFKEFFPTTAKPYSSNQSGDPFALLAKGPKVIF